MVGTSTKADLINLNTYIKTTPAKDKKPFAFVIGAVSVGNPGMENELVTENICISSKSLSAACVCSKICFALENLWGVVWEKYQYSSLDSFN